MTDVSETDLKDRLLDAALMHVPFDGWSETSFRAALADTGTDAARARSLFPRGAVDMALAFHRRGDDAMLARLADSSLQDMRIREKIAHAVQVRLEVIEDKEAVRRGTTLFALPIYAADGARAIWGTCDAIWTAIGDTSEDINWYSKRAILSGVYGSTVLYWLGDDSLDHQSTWDFLGRRIDNVMQIEKTKAQLRKNPVTRHMMSAPDWLFSRIKAPQRGPQSGLPGMWGPRT